MKTNKQTIDSNAVSKVFNRKRWTGQSFSKMKTPANIVKRKYFYVCVGQWHSFFLLCVGGYDLLLAGCDLFYLGLGGCGWVRPFLARCGWVWMSVTFFWVGVGECDLFLAGVGGCGWVWPFFDWVWVSVGECGWVHSLQLPVLNIKTLQMKRFKIVYRSCHSQMFFIKGLL